MPRRTTHECTVQPTLRNTTWSNPPPDPIRRLVPGSLPVGSMETYADAGVDTTRGGPESRAAARAGAGGTLTRTRTRPSTASSSATPTSSGAPRGCARPTPTCSATSPATACWRSAAAPRRVPAGWRPRARRSWPATCRPAMLRHAAPGRPDRASEVPLVQADATALPFADGSFDIACYRVRRGAVRRRLGAGDGRGVPGPAARRPLGRSRSPTRCAGCSSTTRARAGWSPSTRTSTAAPYVEQDEDGVPTYVEQHRTLGDRVRELVGGRFRPRRPRRAGVAGGPRAGSGASGARCAAGSSRARRSSSPPNRVDLGGPASPRPPTSRWGAAGVRVSGRRRASCGRSRPRRPSGTSADGGAHLLADQRLDGARARRGRPRSTSSSCTCSSIRERRPASRSARVDAEHGDLDDVGGRALDRGVERHPLGHLAALPVVAGEVGQVAAAAEDRLGEARRAGPRRRSREVVAHPAEGARSTRPSGPWPRRW